MHQECGCSKHRAFTLVELLIVIIIIGTLAGLMLLGADALFGNSKEARCLNDRKVLEREYMLKRLDDPLLTAALILQTLAASHNASFDAMKISGICPDDGIFTCSLTDSDRMIKISCSKHDGTEDALPPEWASSTSYKIGDTMMTNGYIFRCLRDHTSGNSPSTRNPSERTNKGTWEAIGFVGDSLSYNSVVRYSAGFRVEYNGNIYERTAYNPTSGQTPFNDRSSSYWTLIGPKE